MATPLRNLQKMYKKENTHLLTQSSVQKQPHCHQQSSSQHQHWTQNPPNGPLRQQFSYLVFKFVI